MKDVIRKSVEIFECVQLFTHKLSYLISAAGLRLETTLQARLGNATRWSSTSEILKHFLDLYNVLPNLGMKEIDDLLPDAVAHKNIETLCKQLTDIVSITKCLQNPCTTLKDARVLLNTVIDCLPLLWTMHDRLGAYAEIVENRKFESALVIVKDGYGHKLTAAEKKLCSTYSTLLFSLGGLAVRVGFSRRSNQAAQAGKQACQLTLSKQEVYCAQFQYL